MSLYSKICIVRFIIYYFILSIFITVILCHNKYAKEANVEKNENPDFRPLSLKHLDRPFRMAKLNLLWSKAVLRLSDPKLKSLFGELKLHDKEEITWKHLRAEGKDKDGLKEAELRKKLIAIMGNYDLLDQVEDVSDPAKARPFKALNEATDKRINKNLFKDKKLNKLWDKAETAGFTQEELLALKEEFGHYQDKIDQYYALLHDVKGNPEDYEENSVDDSLDKYNKIEILEEKEPNKDYLDKVNLLREKHNEIRDGFNHLSILSAKGPASKEFVEPKVQGLWKVALESNFTPSELESLKVELRHYENRLLKLRHLQAEHALHEEKFKDKKINIAGGKTDHASVMVDNIKKQARKVEKIHLDIETRIMQKHIEL